MIDIGIVGRQIIHFQLFIPNPKPFHPDNNIMHVKGIRQKADMQPILSHNQAHKTLHT